MGWIKTFVVWALGGAVAGITYATGFDQVIYRTLANWISALFVYLLAKCVDLLCWLLDMLPALPYSADFTNGITQIIIVAVRANTFFPVVEAFYLFGFFIGFLAIFICIKLLLKIIPWAIG